MTDTLVYGDLNCPYSYALFERLKSLNLLDQIEYRLVEHAPDIGLYGNSPDILTELASDVFSVRSQASEVRLALPPERPDSRFAILCCIAAYKIDPALALKFIERFYRALWVDGEDISSPSVIFNCQEQVGLPPDLEVNESEEEQLEQWQSAWENSGFSSRVPSMIAADGRKLIGLPSKHDIRAFFSGEERNIENLARELTHYSDHHTIAVLSPDGVSPIWSTLDSLRSDYNILLPSSFNELKQQLMSAEQAPDLVLLHDNSDWQQQLTSYQKLLTSTNLSYIPIALIGAERDDHQELAAYAAGASDYLVSSRPPGILKARIAMLLELKRSRDFLERTARLDGLTGVNNRREFERILELEWRRSSRASQAISIIMVDVDHFKSYNDHYGHLAGDSALRRIADVLQNSISRPHDTVCRYGGEEFVVLLPETNIAGAEQVANNIRSQLENLAISHEKSPTASYITASQGLCSLVPDSSNSPHMLVEKADQALYDAKGQSRNCIVKGC